MTSRNLSELIGHFDALEDQPGLKFRPLFANVWHRHLFRLHYRELQRTCSDCIIGDASHVYRDGYSIYSQFAGF